MTNKICCMVVNGDEINRPTTVSLLSEYTFIKIISIFDSPVKELAVIKQRAPEVLFLVIDMTEKSSLQF